MTNILILGHTGFLGKSVFKIFTEDKKFNLSGISLSNGYDLRNVEVFKDAVNKFKPDYIINCCAHVGSLKYVTDFAAYVFYDNALIVNNLYKSVCLLDRKIKVLNIIANCAFPDSFESFREGDLFNGPLNQTVESYGFTRRMLYMCGKQYKKQYDIDSYYLISPNMYGPGDSCDPSKAHAVNALVVKCLNARDDNLKLSVWGDGSPIREWLYVKDCARLIFEVISKNNTNALNCLINIGQNVGVSINDIIDSIENSMNITFHRSYMTDMPNGAPCKIMNDKIFKEYFPQFEFTKYSDGLNETIKHYDKVL